MLGAENAVHGSLVVLYVAPSGGPARAGFVAGRRVGGAVIRNRARRLLRVAWRAVAPEVREGHDIVLVARAAIREAKAQDVIADTGRLLVRAGVLR